METDNNNNNNNNNNSRAPTVNAENLRQMINLASNTSGLPPTTFSVHGGRPNSTSSFSSNNHNILASNHNDDNMDSDAGNISTDDNLMDSETNALLGEFFQSSNASIIGNKRKKIDEQEESSEFEGDLMAMIKAASGTAEQTLSLSCSEVMYLILRKYLSAANAREFAKVLMNADPVFVADIIRAKTAARGELYVDIRNEVMMAPYDVFANLRTRISSTMRGQIRNYKDLMKDFMSRAAFCDISKDGVVSCGGKILFTRGSHAYVYNNLRMDNYAEVFHLDTTNFVDDRKEFFFVLFCTSNGHFILNNGNVSYMLNDLDSGDNVIFSRFIIPRDIRTFRVGFANVLNKMLAKKTGHELSYSFISKLYVEGIDAFQNNISDSLNAFYEYDNVVKGNERAVLQNINSFSQNNKTWRKQKDVSWFVPTPEFDYWDKNINMYPKHSRNMFVGIKGALKEGPITGGNVYDLTGVDPVGVEIQGVPKGMFMRYAIDDKWTRKFNTKFDVNYTYLQEHSLMVLISPKQGVTPTIDSALKAWYMNGFRIFRGEVAYMINMLTGRFPLSGTVSIARKAHVKLGTRASKIAQYF
jgi:hypothetical protein